MSPLLAAKRLATDATHRRRLSSAACAIMATIKGERSLLDGRRGVRNKVRRNQANRWRPTRARFDRSPDTSEADGIPRSPHQLVKKQKTWEKSQAPQKTTASYQGSPPVRRAFRMRLILAPLSAEERLLVGLPPHVCHWISPINTNLGPVT